MLPLFFLIRGFYVNGTQRQVFNENLVFRITIW